MTALYPTKDQLFLLGQQLIHQWCDLNGIACPLVKRWSKAEWAWDACAFYRPATINICVDACASIGTAGRAWSFPGHAVDRTPYGVLAHELGHHVDVLRSTTVDRYRGNFSADLRRQASEPKLTNYCPDDGEWFAEMFRLFVTNPDLLRGLRPRTYAALIERGFCPVFCSGDWRTRLAGAPERTIAINERRVGEVRS